MFRFLYRVSTSNYFELLGPGWHLPSPGRKRNVEDFTGANGGCYSALAVVCLLEIAVLWILISPHCSRQYIAAVLLIIAWHMWGVHILGRSLFADEKRQDKQ
jgi:hypothetical protein